MSFSSKMAEAVVSGATALYDRISGPSFDRENQEYDQSHSSGRHEARGIGVHPTDEEILDQKSQRQSHKLAKLESAIGHINHEIRSIKAELPDSRARNQEIKKEIETVNQDLTATRAYAPEEGTMLRGEVIKEFVEVGQCIDDIINAFLQRCSHHINRPISRPRAREIREHFRGKEDMQDSDRLVELASGQNLQQLTELLLRHYLCLALEQLVFQPFLPGERQGDPAAAFLSEIIATVQTHESQDRSGRWRALTYKQAMALRPRDEKWYAEPATLLVKEMSNLALVISGVGLATEAVETAFQLTSRMFNIAAEFKDKATMICTEADFRVYLPFGNNPFDPRFMEEACKGRSNSKGIILGVGLGLLLRHNTQKDSTYAPRYGYPVLALVIGDKSGFFT